jgi:hypothetical protein
VKCAQTVRVSVRRLAVEKSYHRHRRLLRASRGGHDIADAIPVMKSRRFIGSPDRHPCRFRNFIHVGWGNLHLDGAVPPSADLYEMASHDRELVSAEMGELGRPHRAGGLAIFGFRFTANDER